MCVYSSSLETGWCLYRSELHAHSTLPLSNTNPPTPPSTPPTPHRPSTLHSNPTLHSTLPSTTLGVSTVQVPDVRKIGCQRVSPSTPLTTDSSDRQTDTTVRQISTDRQIDTPDRLTPQKDKTTDRHHGQTDHHRHTEIPQTNRHSRKTDTYTTDTTNKL